MLQTHLEKFIILQKQRVLIIKMKIRTLQKFSNNLNQLVKCRLTPNKCHKWYQTTKVIMIYMMEKPIQKRPNKLKKVQNQNKNQMSCQWKRSAAIEECKVSKWTEIKSRLRHNFNEIVPWNWKKMLNLHLIGLMHNWHLFQRN